MSSPSDSPRGHSEGDAPPAQAHAPVLPRHALQRAIVRLNIAGALGTAFATLTNGIFRVGFARRLGANDFHIGVLTAVVPLTNTVQLLSAYLTEKIGDRRKLSLLSFATGRSLWILILLIPFTGGRLTSTLAVQLLLGLLIAYSIVSALGVSAWYSWVADVVPEKERSRFFGNRFTMLTFVAMACALLAGWAIDLVPQSHQFVGFAVIFGLGLLLGELDLWIHRRVPHPEMDKSTQEMSFGELAREPWTQPAFRRFLVMSVFHNLAAYVPAGLGQVYLLETLKLSYFWITMLGTFFSLTTAVAYQMWGNIGRKVGQRTVMTLCLAGGVLLGPIYFFLSPGSCFPPLVFVYLASGTVSAGTVLAGNALLFDLFPRKAKSMYVAQCSCIVGAVAAVSSVLGGAVGYRLAPWLEGVTFRGHPVTNFHILLLASMLFQCIAIALLQRVPDTKAVSPIFVMTQIFITNPMRLLGGLMRFGLATTEEARRSSTRSLGATKSKLVVEELVAALEDPSSQVREHAVESLGEVGGAEAVSALLPKLGEEDTGLQALAARALGQISDRSAVPALAKLLEHSEPSVRAAAAGALGRISDPQAAKALLLQIEAEESLHAFVASAEALGRHGELEAIWTILPALRRTNIPALRRQLTISIGNILGREGEFYRILNEEAKTHGQVIKRTAATLTSKRMGAASLPGSAAEQFAETVNQAREAYLAEDWPQTVRLLAASANLLLSQCLAARGQIRRPVGNGDDRPDLHLLTDAAMLHDEQIGVTAWFIAVMSEQADPLWEETLLTFYGLLCLAEKLVNGG